MFLQPQERYHLLESALGDDTFTLDPQFRERLGKTLGLTVPLDAFVAMDYHLDWIALSLYLTACPEAGDIVPKKGALKEFNKDQMDTDLLVAFEQEGTTHLVLIEAKGDTGWTNKQMNEKAERLGPIFGAQWVKDLPVQLHFMLMSPRESKRLDPTKWPEWMKPNNKPLWMKLTMGEPGSLKKATRSGADRKPSSDGKFLTIDPV